MTSWQHRGAFVWFACVCVCFPSSHALTSDVSIEETAKAAEFFLSDGIIVTGVATGAQADPQELKGGFHQKNDVYNYCP